MKYAQRFQILTPIHRLMEHLSNEIDVAFAIHAMSVYRHACRMYAACNRLDQFERDLKRWPDGGRHDAQWLKKRRDALADPAAYINTCAEGKNSHE